MSAISGRGQQELENQPMASNRTEAKVTLKYAGANGTIKKLKLLELEELNLSSYFPVH